MSKESRKQVSKARRITGIVVALVLITALLEIALGNVRAFQVVSRSMEPTLMVGDCVLSVRHMVHNKDLGGAVVAFEPDEPGDAMVKRVVAGEGQVVEVRDRRLYVEGSLDRYADMAFERVLYGRWNVDEGCLFVVGDNRNNSFDSIDHGPIEREQLLGVVAFRYWPLGRIGLVE